MADRPLTKSPRVFRWLLPGIYLGAFALLMMGNVLGAGHTPVGLQFLIPVVAAPCYLMEFLLPLIPNVFLKVIICVIFGTIFFIAAGLLIDLLLNRLRSPKPDQT
jgi:hypothetical protein